MNRKIGVEFGIGGLGLGLYFRISDEFELIRIGWYCSKDYLGAIIVIANIHFVCSWFRFTSG